MILSAIAVLAMTQDRQAVSPSFQGLWVSPSGRVLIVARPHTWYLEANDVQMTIRSMLSVPDGSMLGSWAGSGRLELGWAEASLLRTPEQPEADSPLGSTRKARAERNAPRVHPFVRAFDSDRRPLLAPTNYGDARLSWGPPTSGGTYNNFDLALFNARSTRLFSERFFFAGTEDQISLAGTFRDQGVTMTITDTPKSGESADLDGTVVYNGKSHVLWGSRSWSRGWFQLFDPSRGSETGYGYAIWTPSAEEAQRIRNKGRVTSTRIRVFLWLHDRSFPSGLYSTSFAQAAK